ncbi:MAG: DUF2264 domain-containing protein, partial [Opitutaceae bacterium]|nr:DUF2264 domain-containing protein [Opitutaceae bacterium]
ADNALDVTYERAATVGRFVPVVESSVDLVSWGESNVDQSYLEQVLPGGRVQVTARIQPRAVRQFARLRARDIQQMDTLTPDTTRDLFARLLLNWGTKVNTAGTRDTYGSAYSYEWVTRMVTPMAAWLSQPGRPGTLSVGASTVNVAETLRRALVNGTDPAEATRWPFPANQADQIVVEAQQPAFAAWLLHDATNRSGAPGAAVWSGFTSAQRSNLASFLSATGSPSFSYTNNWNLFVTINQEACKRLALAGVSEFSGYSQSAINTGLEKIQAMHRGGGWYADSDTEDIFDDYIPYVLLPEQMNHFIMGRADTQAQTVIPGTNGRGRAEILADVSAWLRFQVRTFDATGGNPEYGRSSSYKFSRLRPLLQAYYIDRVLNTPTGWNLGFKVLPAEITPGMLRRLVRLHLSHYLANGSIDPVTFALRNGQSADSSPEIKESYTHDGSVYWAMNAFTALFMLPNDDPLWSAVEEPLPSETTACENWYQRPGFLLRTLPAQGHVELFNLRVIKNAWMGDEYYNKYTKFAYSSRFGYCTKSGSRLDQAITVGSGYRQNPLSGDYYLPPGHVDGEPGVMRTTHAQGTATIKTLIFLRDGAQVRVQRVLNASGLRIRDGGYALGNSTGVTQPVAQTGADWIYLESPEVGAQLVARLLGHTSVASLSGTGNHSRQAQWRLPYAETPSASGATFDCATLFYASSVRFDPATARARVGGVTVNGGTATLTWGDGTVVSADFP